jgi:hypothetical protein
MLKLRHLLFLACAVPVGALWQAGSASAEVRFGSMMRPSAMRPGIGALGGPARTFAGIRNRGFGLPGGHLPGGGGPGPHFARGGSHGADHGGFRHGHSAQRSGQQQHGSRQHGQQQQHGQVAGPAHAGHTAPPVLAHNGLPRRPFPGEPGFTGVPPQGETRFVSHEMVVHVGAEVTPQALDAAAHRLGLTAVASQNLELTGGRLVHFRGQGDMTEAIRTLETEKLGIAQPNYLFRLQQDIRVPAAVVPVAAVRGDPAQYVIDKLHLREAHAMASGTGQTVAVIDSLIDIQHPDLIGSIAGQYDAVSATDKPDEHGTGMSGAIAAHRRLLGVAPNARILAIHAFSPDAKHPQQATTQSIVAGIDWAISQGARVINMSFAGPYDPVLQLALKKAHERGVVLIAAAGNMGPQSPPLYPAADESVIAVTAVDDRDRLLPQANQGAHVALAAPGVNVLEAAPRATYNYTTGTSVAAAHVSGVAALLLERRSGIDVASLEDALYSTARDLGAPGRDSQFGYGLVDPLGALNALEAKTIARHPGTPETTASADPRHLAIPAPLPASQPKPPPGAAVLVSGAPAGPIGPATPRVAGAPAAVPAPATAGKPAPRVAATPAALPRPAAGNDEAAALEKKRQACRQAGTGQGVNASGLSDYVAICVSEARVACLKQAVAQKVRVPERREFLNRCLQGS